MGHLIGQAISGLIIGAIAKLLVPGKGPGGLLVTALIGVVGALLGTLTGRAIRKDENYSAGWIPSIVGAIVVILLYRWAF